MDTPGDTFVKSYQIRLPVSPYYYEITHSCTIFGLSNQTLCYYDVVHFAQLILLPSWVLIKIRKSM